MAKRRKKGISTGLKIAIGVVGLGAIGTGIYFLTRKKTPAIIATDFSVDDTGNLVDNTLDTSSFIDATTTTATTTANTNTTNTTNTQGNKLVFNAEVIDIITNDHSMVFRNYLRDNRIMLTNEDLVKASRYGSNVKLRVMSAMQVQQMTGRF